MQPVCSVELRSLTFKRIQKNSKLLSKMMNPLCNYKSKRFAGLLPVGRTYTELRISAFCQRIPALEITEVTKVGNSRAKHLDLVLFESSPKSQNSRSQCAQHITLRSYRVDAAYRMCSSEASLQQRGLPGGTLPGCNSCPATHTATVYSISQ